MKKNAYIKISKVLYEAKTEKINKFENENFRVLFQSKIVQIDC